ncbi:aromatic ring-hydroxylating dioxygenase subunit alpha [Cohnella lubricantis]|uniref:Aromatic ring-hydroxylating dioxygenase subunit alpha n=1 Tax=Cohnella lubricantis TaxID=2163172 RepID=A0A841T744_9BACL|nr:aromatic ring-hydroxylating dioxygenase subunit alpha [Cohnella lubricantis]MBB6677154.1 aromatic ring-hydroxylating dioxygenase subunit alpha [Cohnella lubricantis]MBP2117035.1 phenylpropionate dioxygenase-like ring-hydroxylating dioxygenase large terminal subunit [Cohnella lubricantis]
MAYKPTEEVITILNQLGPSLLETKEARSMPAEVYTSQAFFDFEKEAVFARNWLCVGRQEQIPNPGDYYTIQINDDPLIVTRDKKMNIHVISAVCQHRGHIVAEGSGNCKNFRCPLHWWTYGLDGELISAPEMIRIEPFDILRHDHSLPSLKVEIWNGFIFCHFDPDAPPLAPTLTKLNEEMANYRVNDLVAMPFVDIEGCEWNWKIMIESSLEPYHTNYLHKGPHDFAPSQLAGFIDFDENDGQIMHPTGFTHVDAGFSPDMMANFPAISTLTLEQRQKMTIAAVPPMLTLGLMPDQVFWNIILPQGPGRILFRSGLLYPPETVSLPDFEERYKLANDSIQLINEQDLAANASLQKGLTSRLSRRGRYAALERTLPQLNKWLAKRYFDYAKTAGVDLELVDPV